MISYLITLVTESPCFHGISGGNGFKSRFDWPLGPLLCVLLISTFMAFLRSVIKLVGQELFTLKHIYMHPHTHTRQTQTNKFSLPFRDVIREIVKNMFKNKINNNKSAIKAK